VHEFGKHNGGIKEDVLINNEKGDYTVNKFTPVKN
jgi:hypothetical protein